MRSRRRPWRFWIVLWCALVAVGFVAQFTAWSISLDHDLPTPVHLAASVVNVAMAPGQFLWKWITGSPERAGIIANITVAVMGATILTLGIWTLAQIRSALRSRGRREAKQWQAFDPTRRRFLVDASSAGVCVLGAGAAANATLRSPWQLRVSRHDIRIRDLPAQLDGLRLVQLSDTHYGPHVLPEFIQRAIDDAIALEPDLFLLTGDYVTQSARFIAPAAEQLRAIGEAAHPTRPPLGVLGNHDWDADGPACRAALMDAGIRMIDNTRVFLDAASRAIVDEPTAECLCIAGVGDLWRDRIDAHHAFLGVAQSTPRLLLSHQPDVAEFADLTGIVGGVQRGAGKRVDLMISGHLHGGQVKLPLVGAPVVPSRFGQKYLEGIVHGPSFPVLISRGVGMSVLPVRWGAPPEIVEITLRRST